MPTVLLGAALLATLGLLLALRPAGEGKEDLAREDAATARPLWLLAALVPLLWSLTAALLSPP